MGRLLVLTAVALLVSGMDDDTVPALGAIGLALQSVPLAMLLHLLVAFPSGRIRGRAARVVVAAAYGDARRSVRPGGRGRRGTVGRRTRNDAAGGVLVRVIIAEDEVLLREGIARILADEDYQVVGLAGDRDDLIGKVRALRPELVVTDIRMPPTLTDEGLSAALQIRQEFPAIAIVVLSQHVDTAGAAKLLSLGAERIGYLLKLRVMDLDGFLESVGRVRPVAPASIRR